MYTNSSPPVARPRRPQATFKKKWSRVALDVFFTAADALAMFGRAFGFIAFMLIVVIGTISAIAYFVEQARGVIT